MKRAVPILFDTLHTLALALWLGGLVCYWAVAVPAIQQNAGTTAAAMNAILNGAKHRLDGWFELCGAVMVCTQWALRRRFRADHRLHVGDAVRTLLTFGAFMLAEMASAGAPRAAVLRASARPDSTVLGLAVGEAALLVSVAALTAWLQLPRIAPGTTSHGPAAPAAPQPQPPRPAAKSRKKRARR